jgi:hypothetical protein
MNRAKPHFRDRAEANNSEPEPEDNQYLTPFTKWMSDVGFESLWSD